jgi:hypothetical protein
MICGIKVIGHNVCFDFLYTFALKHFFFSEELKQISYMCIGLNENTRYSCHILMKVEFSRQLFEKSSNIKLHENPSRGNRVVRCERTDMMKLVVAVRSFANAPKNRTKIMYFFLPPLQNTSSNVFSLKKQFSFMHQSSLIKK